MKRNRKTIKQRATKLIIALDVDNFSAAKQIIDLLYPNVKIFKVGLQLFLAAGESTIRYIKRKGGLVFLDLKFYDIPNTVAAACREMVRLGVDMFTIHSQGGLDMLIAAKQAVDKECKRLKKKAPLVLGVTVLTSKGREGNIKQRVLDLAKEASKAGLDGIVCSAQEAETVRKKIGRKFLIITPGIRLDAQDKQDQQRTATPKEAKQAGSNYLVVGRPIIKSKCPLKVAEKILADIK